MTFGKPREIALRLLRQRESGREFIEDLLETALARQRLSPADRGLLQELAYGVVRWQATLDWLIARKTAGRTQRPALQILLRLGLYQIFWLSRIPDHAAVNESVELARREGLGGQSGFVNAILRGYLRERDQTMAALEELKQSDPALAWSHPAWLCPRWEKTFGRENLLKLLAWNNVPPATFARVNSLRAIPDQLREQWEREKVRARLVPIEWAGESLVYELEFFPPLATLPSFTTGKFYVQDPSTLLAVGMLQPAAGETILDLCAAPGGKTTLIAERMRNEGRITALDMDPSRLKLIEENCRRLGVTCVATALPSSLDARPATLFDRILIDAPCSNTGVMRRRVDLRWRIREEEITRLHKTQLQLLHNAAPRLRPGGVLVYSTCSLEEDENAGVIRAFLKENPEFHLQRERALTPWTEQTDGAYAARLIKSANFTQG